MYFVALKLINQFDFQIHILANLALTITCFVENTENIKDYNFQLFIMP